MKIKLPRGKSAFLWGPRKTGKSMYLRHMFHDSLYFNLLKTDLRLRLMKEPSLLREEILAAPEDTLRHPIIIDEIQKVPELLDEVHYLIEEKGYSFILCGSSARKVKKEAANLLGGRAWKFQFFPLVYPEIETFDLLRVLNHGLMPAHYLEEHPQPSLRAYIDTYLTEEIQAESQVRNLPAYARFLDAVGFTHGEMTNFNNIARDCGVNAKTVKEYYQILVDTLLGTFVEPFAEADGRSIISSIPKFYLFDVGLVAALTRRHISVLKGMEAGKAFEHYVFMELCAYLGIHQLDDSIRYWRTKTGLEVDFVLARGQIAIEAKLSQHVDRTELVGLTSFVTKYCPRAAYVVSLDPRPRKIELDNQREILILPLEHFLKKLWSGHIL